MVRAIDATVTTAQGNQITEALRRSRDKRIKYVIWNRRSFSPESGWEWRAYSGAPHDKHLHLSVLATQDTNGESWDLGADMPWQKPGDDVETIADIKAVHAWQGNDVMTIADIDYDENDPAQLDERWKFIVTRLLNVIMKP